MKQILPRLKAAMPPTSVNKGSGENAIENTGVFSALSPAAFWLLCRRGQSNIPRK